MSEGIDERTAALEARLAMVEDRLEIADLIARYGPAADSGSSTAIQLLWVDGGSYEFDSVRLVGEEIGGLVELETHRALMTAGCAHFLSAPRIEIDRDVAVAVNHSIVLQRNAGGWDAVRVSANRWDLVRTPDGWRVQRRRNSLLDGADTARALLDP